MSDLEQTDGWGMAIPNQNASQPLALPKLETGDVEMVLAMLETSRQQIVTSRQNTRRAMDAVHGLAKFSVYLGERFTDVVVLVENLFLYSGALPAEEIERIAQRIELMGQRLDEIELKTARKVINLV